MEYKHVKEIHEGTRQDLLNKLNDPNLTAEEIEKIKTFITNYDYIIELTDMNHFERGTLR